MQRSSVPQAPPARYGARRHLARLFGVTLVSDIYEKACDAGICPPLDAKRKTRLAAVRAAETLFIHVPKNAGTSISTALYNQPIKHASIRYYTTVAPDLVARVPSFAVLRDPVDRFLSAYAYARSGGGRDGVVSAPFHDAYRNFRSIDDALDHVEAARGPYEIDHIFRPQNWYVVDWRGAVAVDRLLLLEEVARIGEIVPNLPIPAVPHLNRGHRLPVGMNLNQLKRLRRLYGRDYELVERLRSERGAPALAEAG